MKSTGTTTDRAEIARLVHAYAVAMDEADPGAFLHLFIPAGSLVVLAPGRERPLAVFDRPGPEGIGMIATLMGEIYESTQHHVTSHVATIEGDRAGGTTYCVATHVLVEDGLRNLETLCVRYAEEFVRTPDGWRFGERRVTQMWALSTPAPRRPLAIDRAAARRRR